MLDPQKHGPDDESLARIREALQFEYDVALHNGGNTGIREVNIAFTERTEDGIPLHSVSEAVDERGRAWTLTSRRFSGLVLPLSEKDKDVVVYENFSGCALAETGEQGVGIDEYLENPG